MVKTKEVQLASRNLFRLCTEFEMARAPPSKKEAAAGQQKTKSKPAAPKDSGKPAKKTGKNDKVSVATSKSEATTKSVLKPASASIMTSVEQDFPRGAAPKSAKVPSLQAKAATSDEPGLFKVILQSQRLISGIS